MHKHKLSRGKVGKAGAERFLYNRLLSLGEYRLCLLGKHSEAGNRKTARAYRIPVVGLVLKSPACALSRGRIGGGVLDYRAPALVNSEAVNSANDGTRVKL